MEIYTYCIISFCCSSSWRCRIITFSMMARSSAVRCDRSGISAIFLCCYTATTTTAPRQMNPLLWFVAILLFKKKSVRKHIHRSTFSYTCAQGTYAHEHTHTTTTTSIRRDFYFLFVNCGEKQKKKNIYNSVLLFTIFLLV